MKKVFTKSKFCIVCRLKFERHYGEGIEKWYKRKFCSHKCYWENLKGKISEKRRGKMIECLICKSEFYRKKRGGNKKFCSMKCYQKYHRARKNVKCIICGKIFNVNKANQAKYCSRKCYNIDRFYNETKVVKIARKFLKSNGIREKTFNDLLSDKNRRLRFDVYFKKYNLAIEYNGEQHYEYVSRFGNRPLELVQRSDNLKKKYCIKNNIKLLTVKYNQEITYKNISNLIKLCLKR